MNLHTFHCLEGYLTAREIVNRRFGSGTMIGNAANMFHDKRMELIEVIALEQEDFQNAIAIITTALQQKQKG